MIPDPLDNYRPSDRDLFEGFMGRPSELIIRWAYKEINKDIIESLKILGIQ